MSEIAKTKKKVAIITWITYRNVGTFLQAYALQTVIRSLGYDANILSDKIVLEETYGKPGFRTWISVIYHFLRDSKELKRGQKNMKTSFEAFQKQCLLIDDQWDSLDDLKSKYDIYVCGSDQIWSPVLPKMSYYYAAFTDQKKIAYAPSIGQYRCSEDWEQWVKPMLENFEHLSVREEEGAVILENMLQKNVETVVDPTLLLSSAEWNRFVGEHQENKQGYVLCYFLTLNPVYIDFARNFAKEKNLSLKMIITDWRMYSSIDVPLFPGPKEFLQAIKGATYIFTDSFHGSIFSIHFEKRFYTFKRFRDVAQNNQNSRVENLFRKLGILEYFISETEFHKIQDLPPMDFGLIKERLERERRHSLEYLQKSLDK